MAPPRPGSPGVIKICKTILSGAPAEQIRDQAGGLASRRAEEAPGWTLSIGSQDGLQDAVTVIRAVLLNAAS